MKASVCAIALLWAMSGAARADLVEISWDSSDRYENRLVIKPRDFVEVCGTLAEGSRVRWDYDANGSTNFDIHYHAGRLVRFPVKRDASVRADGTLNADTKQTFCWTWRNKSSSPIKVHVQLRKMP